MKLSVFSVVLWSTSLVSGRFARKQEADQVVLNIHMEEDEPQYLIESANGQLECVTDYEKWKFKKECIPIALSYPIANNTQASRCFGDTKDYRDLGNIRSQTVQKYQYPREMFHKIQISPLLQDLNKTYIQTHLEYLTSFHNRWYKSPYGEASYHWLLSTVMNTIASTGAHKYGIKAQPFIHPWGQNSIVVTIPGKSNSTVVVGAHQDSVNHADPMYGRAPGADDDGSGTVTILEVLRVLLSSKELVEGKAENTVEFHWYSGEEGGCLGSRAIFLDYAKRGKDVKAMLEQDMTGFYNATIENKKEFGLMMDVADKPLMEYVKLIIEEYTDLPWVETGCGPHCGSDHMSAINAGYPGIFVIEGRFEYTDNHVHGDDDLIEYLDYDHMIDHAQMTLGFLYELAFAKL